MWAGRVLKTGFRRFVQETGGCVMRFYSGPFLFLYYYMSSVLPMQDYITRRAFPLKDDNAWCWSTTDIPLGANPNVEVSDGSSGRVWRILKGM